MSIHLHLKHNEVIDRKNVYHVLFRKEAYDIFGFEYGNTYVTITTDRKSIFFILRIQILNCLPKDCRTSSPSYILTMAKD